MNRDADPPLANPKEHLTPRQHQIWDLRHTHGKTLRAVANQLGIHHTTVQAHLRAATLRLQAAHGEPPPPKPHAPRPDPARLRGIPALGPNAAGAIPDTRPDHNPDIMKIRGLTNTNPPRTFTPTVSEHALTQGNPSNTTPTNCVTRASK